MKIPIFGKAVEYTLKVSGLWPDYLNIFGVILIMSGLFTLMPFQILDVLKEYDNIFIVLDDLSQILAELMLYSKFLIIFYHRRIFKSLLQEMAADYKNEDNIIYWSDLISASCRFTKFDYGIYAVTASIFYVQFLFIYPIIPVENREMIARAQYPFDFKSSPTYEIMTAIQIVQGLAMCSIQALSESLLVALVLHVCGHIDLLSDKIEQFSLDSRSNRKNSSLEIMINQHLKIIDSVDKIDKVYTYASFVQVFLSTFMICCSAFIVIAVTDNIVQMIKYGMLCLSAIWQGYSFCFSGQRLINKSEQIANKLYETCWHNANSREIRALSYMIHKSQTPLILTAGKFTSLSAQTFTAMMKTSFSYISVLRATKE